MAEAAELLNGAILLPPDSLPPSAPLEAVGMEVDARIEDTDILDVNIHLDEQEVAAMYVLAEGIASMGLYEILGRLRVQHRRMLHLIGVRWQEIHEKVCREDAENISVTAQRFKALVDAPNSV